MANDISMRVIEPIAIAMRVHDASPVTMSVGERIVVTESDYNKLSNKPQINGQTLIGNQTTEQLFANGFILDGGDAEWITGVS